MATFVNLLVFVLYLYTWIIILRAVVSWVNPNPQNPLMQLLYAVTEPVLGPLRKILPPARLGGLDVSPILAIILIQALRYLLLGALY